jgi:hypothetical protein
MYYGGTREDAAFGGFDDDQIYKEIHLDPKDRTVPGY